MNAHAIGLLLKARHSEDVFLGEVPDGPVAGSRSFRLDAWAMAKSWSNPTTYGYEIKVSKSDFRADEKWQNYLPLCSDFYFVCPWGMIQPEEVAHPAGLMWVAKTGTRLWIKRKAARRQVSIPEEFWRVVAMRLDQKQPYKNNAEFWRDWLAGKEHSLDVGHRVSRRLRELISEKILMVESDNRILKSQNEKLQDAKRIMDLLGVNYYSAHQFEQDMRERMNGLFSSDLTLALERVRNEIDRLLKKKPREAHPTPAR